MTCGSPIVNRWVLALVLCAFWANGVALAQFPPGGNPSRFELSDKIQLERADGTVQTYLKRVDAYLADRQWNEAIDTLLQAMESSGNRLYEVTAQRLVSIDRYCQLRLMSLPPEALALYRQQVDPLAKKWYEQGVAQRDRRLLLQVVDQMLASSWGDDALWALGEMALERGDYASARAAWEKAIPVEQPGEGPRTWLSVPDTDLELAGLRARLVLVSILEGSRERAKDELEQFARLHPDARGRIGGQEGNYVEMLRGFLAESAQWQTPASHDNWPTFAGSPERNRIAAGGLDGGTVAWRLPLRKSVLEPRAPAAGEAPRRRVAEDVAQPLSYHPVVMGNLVLLCNQVEALAIDLKTGKPTWGHENAAIYRDQYDEAVHLLHLPSDSLGVPRFTMTVFRGKAYARMGSPVNGGPREETPTGRGGYLIALDLEAEGRLLWKVAPDDPNLAFEGSPLTDGARVYVAMRRSDIQPQALIACYDAEDGRLLWRQFVCAADTPSRGMLHEMTHNLLTLHGDTLYYNTNLGAVAAISAHDGRVQWVSLYPRVQHGELTDLPPHWSRDLTPCLFDRGRLLVAPADSPQILALEAETGQILWQSGPEVDDAVHLLGVAGNCLLASGQKLYWIGLEGQDRGHVRRAWPDGAEHPGYGRGILAGTRVYFPTRETIYIFDSLTGELKKQIPLAPRGLTGGNLVIAGDTLLIASGDTLTALTPAAAPTGKAPEHAMRPATVLPGTTVLPGAAVILSGAKDLGVVAGTRILRFAQDDRPLTPETPHLPHD